MKYSLLTGNLADDGSILYAMSCKNVLDDRVANFVELTDSEDELVPSLLFYKSTIKDNWAQ